jgi:hypothetical protein
MQQGLIHATQTQSWRAILAQCNRVDPCHLPEYHLAYATRLQQAKPVLWWYESAGHYFAYPFMLAPVYITAPNGDEHPTSYYDISSVYGYCGALTSHGTEADFIQNAWQAFDLWAQQNHVICEFTRFSPFADNTAQAHPHCQISANRILAVSHLSDASKALMNLLPSKTRNMLRKAEKQGLTAREMNIKSELGAFRTLYESTMQRNQATDFFYYDDIYYQHLQMLPHGGLRLFGVFDKQKLVSAAMAITHGASALYHLGANLRDYMHLGAGNLALFAMQSACMQSDIHFVNLTGGRSTALDDPLLRFKKSNGTHTQPYYIGTRIINQRAYEAVAKQWQAVYNQPADTTKIQFYRI